MESAGDEKGRPSWQKAFDVSGRVQNREKGMMVLSEASAKQSL